MLISLLISLGERTSLRETITEALRGAIVTGELSAGRVYSATALAQRLGVSATPVREAMLSLAQEGMVEAVRNKGFRITELSEADLDHITYVRQLIEVPAVAQITAAPRHAEAVALRGAAEAIVAAASRSDLIEYIRTDREFHLGLLRLSGNDVLVQIVGELRSRSRLYGLASLEGGLVPSAREHLELLDSVVAGDAEGARALMGHHLKHVRGSWAGLPEG